MCDKQGKRGKIILLHFPCLSHINIRHSRRLLICKFFYIFSLIMRSITEKAQIFIAHLPFKFQLCDARQLLIRYFSENLFSRMPFVPFSFLLFVVPFVGIRCILGLFQKYPILQQSTRK